MLPGPEIHNLSRKASKVVFLTPLSFLPWTVSARLSQSAQQDDSNLPRPYLALNLKTPSGMRRSFRPLMQEAR